MHDLMVACAELSQQDLLLSRSLVVGAIVAPSEPAPAVADLAVATAEPTDVVPPDDETFAAMRWSSKLDDASCVLSLIRSLPTAVVEEQVYLYRRRSETAVAVPAQRQGPLPKISVGPKSHFTTKMLVAQRFHKYCRANAIMTTKRMPCGAVKTFINDNIRWTAKHTALRAKTVQKWYVTWSSSETNVLAALVAGEDAPVTISSQKPQEQKPNATT